MTYNNDVDFVEFHNADEADDLLNVLDRILSRGVVIHGDLQLSVANIDLVYIGIKVLLASADTARNFNQPTITIQDTN